VYVLYDRYDDRHEGRDGVLDYRQLGR
jgi:hypothetical protein